jgi:hypothetical protein
VRDKGKEGWLGVDYVPGVVASGGWVCLEWWRVESKLCPWRSGGLSGNFVPGEERLRMGVFVVKKQM